MFTPWARDLVSAGDLPLLPDCSISIAHCIHRLGLQQVLLLGRLHALRQGPGLAVWQHLNIDCMCGRPRLKEASDGVVQEVGGIRPEDV